jgi:hypothetical protein
MRKLTGVIWVSVLLGVVGASGAEAQIGRNDRRDAADRVCVYQNANFQGWEECYVAGEAVENLYTHGNSISSIRIYGRAAVSIYENRDFKGSTAQVTSDIRDLSQFNAGGAFGGLGNWNDRIESIRVSSGTYRAPAPLPTPRVDSRNDPRDNRNDNRNNDRRDDRWDARGRRGEPDSICLYEDTNFRGRVECFDSGSGVRDLGRQGDWSDRVSSIRVIGDGRAAVYLDINYKGERLIIDHDIANLRDYHLRNNKTWDNQISSIEVVGGRGVGNRRF